MQSCIISTDHKWIPWFGIMYTSVRSRSRHPRVPLLVLYSIVETQCSSTISSSTGFEEPPTKSLDKPGSPTSFSKSPQAH